MTKINVIDRTTNEKLDKYYIVFEENVEAIKINQTTYINGNQELINNFASSWSITNAKLFINSFSILDSILDSRMNEDGTIEIIANVGIARIQVIDSTGSISGNGEIVIRKLGSDMEEFLITEWNGSDVKIILPEGRYLARLESENIQGETEFEISMDEKEVLIIVDSMYGMSTNIWIFILSTIITIEIVIIYTIWKKNIKGI